MSVKERIKEYVKSRHMSERAFCLSISVCGAYINNIKVSLAPDKLERIAQVHPDLNLTWLLTGQGDMLNTVPTAPEPWLTTEQGSTQCLPELPYTEEMIKLQAVVIQTQNRQIQAMVRQIALLDEQLACCQTQPQEKLKN